MTSGEHFLRGVIQFFIGFFLFFAIVILIGLFL